MSDTHSAATDRAENGRVESIHRFPHRLIYLLAGLGATIFCIPMIMLFAGEAITPAGLLLFWVAAGIPGTIAFAALRYSVAVTGDKLVIKTAFGLRDVLLVDIEKMTIVSARNGPQLRVTLTGGQELWFNGMLTDFDGLASRLAVRRPGVNP